MLQDRIDALRLPTSLHSELNHLVRALSTATCCADIAREAQLQIAFVLGLETAKRIQPADIEALYIIFDYAVEERIAHLSGITV